MLYGGTQERLVVVAIKMLPTRKLMENVSHCVMGCMLMER